MIHGTGPCKQPLRMTDEDMGWDGNLHVMSYLGAADAAREGCAYLVLMMGLDWKWEDGGSIGDCGWDAGM